MLSTVPVQTLLAILAMVLILPYKFKPESNPKGNSCKGRCGELFKRGRECHCDIECVKFNQCCPDYETECTLEEVVIDATTPPVVPTTDELLPSAAPENEAMDPTDNEPTPTPILPEADTGPNEVGMEALEPAETDEGSSHLPEEQSTSVPKTTISTPITSALTQRPITTQPSEQPLVTTSLAEADELATTPASEQPDISVPTQDPMTETTLEPSADPNNLEADLTEPKPKNPDETEGMMAPKNKTEPQTEQPVSELSENPTAEELMTQNLDPTKKPSPADTTKAQENIKDPPSTKELSTTPDTVNVDLSPTKPPETPTKPKDILDEDSPRDYQADANNDTNICSGRPVNGVTTLRNGTIVVFRGHYFWTLDSKRRPGPPLGITDVWGIPSPIDTVYTRCNCQGKTYFFKGDQYWRFENDIMDPGFPRPISAGFGLSGQITAALSMPQYRSRTESVFFFKTGGLAQRYSYRITPQCGKKVAVYTALKKFKRQADPELGQEIDIRKTWRGFPHTVTSAVSVPSTGGDGYKYYIFSKTKYYSLKMEGNTPVILTPRDGPGKQKSAKSWFKCPETQRS
ncbi:hypothetical protein NFI96_033197 [Prochilodus magdalenae]|nr:hypothetical protein NFI96_033197 [Prochilodus magdalenae]